MISPSGTKSTILYPGNSLINIDGKGQVIPITYPVNDFTKIHTYGAYLTNAFYEENSKGIWKLEISNSNKLETINLKGWKINTIGHSS